jgi:isoprenylcysteine carboxyl methyltransferase (ICMT) family protein YpbQ
MWLNFTMFSMYVVLDILKTYITTKIYVAENNYIKTEGEQRYLDDGIRYANYIQMIEVIRWTIMFYTAFIVSKIVEAVL